MVNKKPPFEALRNPAIETEFNSELLKFLAEMQYRVITVVLDKKKHTEQYLVWRHDPYHYCLRIIVERFVLFLESMNTVGDVMCESRGGKEDMRLKKSFHRIYEEGTEYVPVGKIQTRLTSSQLQVKPKANNIAGLQIADLVAHPSYKRMLLQKDRVENIGKFGKEISEILEKEKYYRSASNQLWGYGKNGYPENKKPRTSGAMAKPSTSKLIGLIEYMINPR